MELADLISHLHVRSLFDTYVVPAPAVERIVRQSADGDLIATADKAEIIGTSAKLEAENPANIGAWSDAGDELDWIVL